MHTESLEDRLNSEVIPDSVPFDEEKNNNTLLRVVALVGALSLVGATAAWATHTVTSRNARRAAANAKIEGVLQERGLTDDNIVVNVTGDSNVVSFSCPGTVQDDTADEDGALRVFYNLDPKTMIASWDVTPQLDQSGQVAETFQPPIEFSLQTESQVNRFIELDLAAACTAVASAGESN